MVYIYIHLYTPQIYTIYDPEAPHLSIYCVLFFICMHYWWVDILILWLFVFWLLPLHSHFGFTIYSYNTRVFVWFCLFFLNMHACSAKDVRPLYLHHAQFWGHRTAPGACLGWNPWKLKAELPFATLRLGSVDFLAQKLSPRPETFGNSLLYPFYISSYQGIPRSIFQDPSAFAWKQGVPKSTVQSTISHNHNFPN